MASDARLICDLAHMDIAASVREVIVVGLERNGFPAICAVDAEGRSVEWIADRLEEAARYMRCLISGEAFKPKE